MEIVHFTTSSSPLSMVMARPLTAIYRRCSIFPRFLIYYANIWVPSKIIGLQGVDFIDLFHWGGLATRVFKTMVENKIAEAGSPEEFQKDQIRPNTLILVSVGALFSRGSSSRVPPLKEKGN